MSEGTNPLRYVKKLPIIFKASKLDQNYIHSIEAAISNGSKGQHRKLQQLGMLPVICCGCCAVRGAEQRHTVIKTKHSC